MSEPCWHPQPLITHWHTAMERAFLLRWTCLHKINHLSRYRPSFTEVWINPFKLPNISNKGEIFKERLSSQGNFPAPCWEAPGDDACVVHKGRKAWHQGRGHQALAQPGHSQPSFIHFFHYSELWISLCWPSNLYIPPGQVLSHSRFLYRSVCGRGLLLEE